MHALLKKYLVVERFIDDEANHVRRSLFSGLYLDDHCEGRSRKITAFKFPILEWEKGKKDVTRFFRFQPLLKDNSAKLLNAIVDAVPHDCDDIYICRHNIGETYIYLSLIAQAIEANGSVRPTLLVRKKEYIPLYKMFIPKAAYLVYLPILRTDLDAHVERSFYYRGKRIISGRKDILDHLRADKLANGSANFVNFMRTDMGVEDSAQMRQPKLCETRQRSLYDKVKVIGLDLKRFILLTPEASTISEMDDEFWRRLTMPLLERGYDIFINRACVFEQSTPLKSVQLDLDEVYLLATQAKGIVGVASGLNVLLSSTSTQMDILYTDSGGIVPAREIIDLFSMSNLDGCTREKIREYDTENIDAETIISAIVNRYQ